MTTYYPRAMFLAASLAAVFALSDVQAQSRFAPEVQRASGAGPARMAAPRIEQEDGIAYVSGGIGIEGRQQTIELGEDMSLQLVFARMPDGVYLADVDVQIIDERGGEVLDVVSSGPMLFAEVPRGIYRITASVDGRAIEHRVKVPAQGQHTEFFYWRDRVTAARS